MSRTPAHHSSRRRPAAGGGDESCAERSAHHSSRRRDGRRVRRRPPWPPTRRVARPSPRRAVAGVDAHRGRRPSAAEAPAVDSRPQVGARRGERADGHCGEHVVGRAGRRAPAATKRSTSSVSSRPAATSSSASRARRKPTLVVTPRIVVAASACVEPGDGLGAVGAVGDHLGQHRVVVRADGEPLDDAAVHAHAVARACGARGSARRSGRKSCAGSSAYTRASTA